MCPVNIDECECRASVERTLAEVDSSRAECGVHDVAHGSLQQLLPILSKVTGLRVERQLRTVAACAIRTVRTRELHLYRTPVWFRNSVKSQVQNAKQVPVNMGLLSILVKIKAKSKELRLLILYSWHPSGNSGFLIGTGD